MISAWWLLLPLALPMAGLLAYGCKQLRNTRSTGPAQASAVLDMLAAELARRAHSTSFSALYMQGLVRMGEDGPVRQQAALMHAQAMIKDLGQWLEERQMAKLPRSVLK